MFVDCYFLLLFFLSENSVNSNLLKVRAEFVVVVVSYSHEKMIIFIPGWEIFTFFTMYFNKKSTMKYGNIRLFKTGRRDS